MIDDKPHPRELAGRRARVAMLQHSNNGMKNHRRIMENNQTSQQHDT